MSKNDDTYQNTKVTIPQGGDELSIDSDGYLNFYGDRIDGERLRTLLIANSQYQTIAASAGKLSVVNLPSGGVVVISGSIGCSNMSAWLTSCYSGARLHVVMTNAGMGGESLGSVYISLSGVTLKGISNGDLSSISLTLSDGSVGHIDFLAIDDDSWAVIEKNSGKVAERPSA